MRGGRQLWHLVGFVLVSNQEAATIAVRVVASLAIFDNQPLLNIFGIKLWMELLV